MREGGGIPVDCAQSNFSSFNMKFCNSVDKNMLFQII